ncbi:MAG: diacylglycerol kinase family protein [Deltaproteobacteria bacterium]|nr:diacylglycerol kinase family protein [Deltaproteobacteria bacterium]
MEQRKVDLGDPDLDTIPPVQTVVVAGAGRGGVAASFRVAIAGVLRTVATQRNMKIHVLSGLMVMIVGMALPLDLSTRVALLFAVAIVFFAEILNTALEALIDLFVKDFHRLAMLAKDAAAGGVLVMAVTTVVVLAEILWMRWDLVETNLGAVTRSVIFGVPLVVVEAVGLFVVRRKRLQVPRLVISLALMVPLVMHTHDPLYAGVALLFVGMAFVARVFYTPRIL